MDKLDRQPAEQDGPHRTPASDERGVNRSFSSLLSSRNSALALVGIVGTFLIFGGQLAHSVKETLDLFFPRPDALALAREDSKDKISRDFVLTTYTRLYRSRNFLARLRRLASDSEIHEAWTKHLQSVEDMASKTMIYTVAFQDFYGDERRTAYEHDIQPAFNEITKSIVELRYSEAVKKLEFPSQVSQGLTDSERNYIQSSVRSIEDALDRLHIRLDWFVACFDPKHQTLTGCGSGSASGSF